MRILAADVDEDGSQDMIITSPTAKSFNIMWQRNLANGTMWVTEFLAQQQGGADYIAMEMSTAMATSTWPPRMWLNPSFSGSRIPGLRPC